MDIQEEFKGWYTGLTEGGTVRFCVLDEETEIQISATGKQLGNKRYSIRPEELPYFLRELHDQLYSRTNAVYSVRHALEKLIVSVDDDSDKLVYLQHAFKHEIRCSPKALENGAYYDELIKVLSNAREIVRRTKPSRFESDQALFRKELIKYLGLDEKQMY
jgi:hypothetical protein